MTPANEIKKLVGTKAVELVKQDMIVGIGTGSTVYWFIEALAEKLKEGLHCIGVPTSRQTKAQAEIHGIPLSTLNDISQIDIAIDGADEIAPDLTLLKGGGGALLQEKMVAAASKELVIIADQSKLVSQLGAFALPVEVIPFGWKQVQARIIHAYNIEVRLRIKEDKPFVTDHGHYILDCFFQEIHDPVALNRTLKNIPGLVEDGLFLNMASMALIGMQDGTIQTLKRNK